MKKNIQEFIIPVIAYCLMPNHFHLLLRVDANKDLSRCMSNILNSYVQALNKRYNRTGPLFAERFKSIHIDKDNYLVHLCRYLHLNPLKGRLVKDLKDWPFSNYLEFVGLRKGTLYSANFLEAYFANPDEYLEFLDDYRLQPPEGFNRFTLD